MKFRYARHTAQLATLKRFYTELLGLTILSEFGGHGQYDGLIMGHPSGIWQIEFTSTGETVHSSFDDDDLLVFYLSASQELSLMRRRFEKAGCPFFKAKNPYWQQHGFQINDPDGHGIIFTVSQYPLDPKAPISSVLAKEGIHHWEAALAHIHQLPYGRTQGSDIDSVLVESRGTCSSKHVLLAAIAAENGLDHVDVAVVMYKMNGENTPGVAEVLSHHGLDYIPEAHVVLHMYGELLDLTSATFDINLYPEDILEVKKLPIEDIRSSKSTSHKAYIQDWLANHTIDFDLDELWQIREACIAAISAQP